MAESEAAVSEAVERALEFLRERITIDAAVLFGSYVNGEPHEYSDIDLAVFSKDVEQMGLRERVQIAVEIQMQCDSKIELHLYPKKALEEARPTNFHGYILKTGRRIV